MVSPYLNRPIRPLEQVLRARDAGQELGFDPGPAEVRGSGTAPAQPVPAEGCRRNPEAAPQTPVPTARRAPLRAA